MKAAGLFKQERPFNGDHALKGSRFLENLGRRVKLLISLGIIFHNCEVKYVSHFTPRAAVAEDFTE